MLTGDTRYRWTRRIIAISISLLLVLVIIRLIWGWDANRRLQAEIDAIRARGERILPGEFQSTPIPADENYITYLTRAEGAFNHHADPPRATDMTFPDFPPMTPQWYALARAAVEGHQTTLQLMRQARQHPHADWGRFYSPNSPIYSSLYPSLNSQRHMANLLADTALYQHLMGNDAESVETIRDLLSLTDELRQNPTLICHLVGIGIEAVALNDIEVMAPTLQLADDPSPSPTTQPSIPAQRKQILELIPLMLAYADHSTADAFTGERMLQLADIDTQTRKSLVLRPLYLLDAVQILKVNNKYIEASVASNYPEATKHFPVFSGSVREPNWISPFTVSSMDRLFVVSFRIRMEARLAAVSLAAQLYRIDHRGQWPRTLDDLVPDYLPKVPADPFTSDGAPLGYIILNNGQRPIVYSVGDDGLDHTKDGVKPPPGPLYDWSRTADQWRDLTWFIPPPSTQPAGE